MYHICVHRHEIENIAFDAIASKLKSDSIQRSIFRLSSPRMSGQCKSATTLEPQETNEGQGQCKN